MREVTPRIVVCLWIIVAAGRRAELLAFLKEAIPVYERPGGIKVRLFEEQGAPESFCEAIEYASREHYLADDARLKTDPEMIRLIARWRGILAAPPTVEVYEAVTAVS